jgi:hypothetical protein
LVLNGDDNYGFSFVNVRDVDGDAKDDFAVGAIHGDGPDVSLSGSVTVFSGGRNWNYDEGLGKIVAKLSGEGPMDKFGLSIAAGDLNDDGIGDLIVGAPFNTHDPKFYQGGAVYIYFGLTSSIRLPFTRPHRTKARLERDGGRYNGDNIPDLCISPAARCSIVDRKTFVDIGDALTSSLRVQARASASSHGHRGFRRGWVSVKS